MTISHEISHRSIGDNFVHIAVTAVMRNSSKVHIEIRKGLFLLQQIAPNSGEDIVTLHKQVFVEKEYEEIQ